MKRVEYSGVMSAKRRARGGRLPRILASIAAAFAFFAPQSSRAEQPSGADAKHLWGFVPSLGVAASFVSIGGNGTIENSVLRPAQGTDPELRRNAIGSESVDFVIYGLTLGLDSPRITFVPTAPRITGRIGLSSGLRAGIDLALSGSPGKLEHPAKPSPEFDVILQDEIKGQGSSINASFGSYFLNGNLGLGFETSIFDRTLRIRPSFEWTLFQMRLHGLTHSANRPGGQGRGLTSNLETVCSPRPAPCSFPTQFIDLDGRGRKQLGGIGPGLELEFEGSRFGPIVTALTLSGQAYRIYGDRVRRLSHSFSDSTVYPATLSVPSGTADWTAKFHRWTYRAGLGIQFYWRPE
jgi:hypothetical protein